MADDDFDFFEAGVDAYVRSASPLTYIQEIFKAATYEPNFLEGPRYVTAFGTIRDDCSKQPLVRFPYRSYKTGEVGYAIRPRDPVEPNAVCYDQRTGDPTGGGNFMEDDVAAAFYNAQFVFLPRLDAFDFSTFNREEQAARPVVAGVLGSIDQAALLDQLIARQEGRRGKTTRQLFLEELGYTEASVAPVAYDPVEFQRACAADPYCTAEVRAALNKSSFEAECALVPGCAELLLAAAQGRAPNPFVQKETPVAFDLGSLISGFQQGSGSILSGDGYSTETTSGEGVFDSIGSGLKNIFDLITSGAGAVGAIGQAISPFVEYNQATVFGPPAPGQSQPMATGGAVANGTLDANALKSLADLLRRNPQAVAGALGAGGALALDAALNGGGGGVINATNLTRTRAAGQYLPSRIQVMVNGQMYILANLGRATHGSREKSVAKKLAKDNGLVCRTRGYGGGRRRRPR